MVLSPPICPVSVIVPDAQENADGCRMDECAFLMEGNNFSYCRDPFLFQTPPPAAVTSRQIFFVLHKSLRIQIRYK